MQKRPWNGLAKFNVTSLSLTSSDVASLRDTFDAIRDKAAALGLTLKFDLPVPYSASNPVVYEAQESLRFLKARARPGFMWNRMAMSCRRRGSSEKVLGNLLRDEWKQIYSCVENGLA